MLTCGDQIHSEPFYCWGWSVPQASVDSDLLHKITLRVAHAAKVSDKGNLIFSVMILIIASMHSIMKLFQCLNKKHWPRDKRDQLFLNRFQNLVTFIDNSHLQVKIVRVFVLFLLDSCLDRILCVIKFEIEKCV